MAFKPLRTRMTLMTLKDLSQLLVELPENFKASPRYESALIHKSHFFESKSSLPHNERLEFLGDAALGLCVAELLFRNYSEKNEGFLTKARANLVNTKVLSDKAKALKLDQVIRVGRSEKGKEGDLPPRILASVLEALIGAIYLELGMSHLIGFIEKLFQDELESEEKLLISDSDWKSKLQEDLQKEFQQTPSYELISADGPDHQKSFHVQVVFQGQVLGQGVGLSRKEAEQEAAKEAWSKRVGEKDE